MKKRMIEFACPNCEASYFLCKDTYLVASGNSQEEKRLRNRTFFRHQCSQCGFVYDLHYPLILRDPKNQYSIILADKMPDSWQGRAVLTRDAKQFQDAYVILSNRLPLKETLEVWKRLEQSRQESCILDGADRERGILWFECANNLLAVKVNFHQSMKKSVE